jgi:hypothetical protein
MEGTLTAPRWPRFLVDSEILRTSSPNTSELFSFERAGMPRDALWPEGDATHVCEPFMETAPSMKGRR